MIIQYSYKKLSSCKSRRRCKKSFPLFIGRANTNAQTNMTTLLSYKHNDTVVIQT